MESPLFLHPEEIIEEIVSRLPVKSLLRFRCVSKSWLSLIDSDRFIKIHFQKSIKNRSLAHHGVVFNVGRDGITGCSLPSLLNWSTKSEEGESSSSSSSSSSVAVAVDPTSPLPKTGFIVGCCKGVSCLSNLKDFSLSLWNPATRVSMELPKLDKIFPKFGFGWDESSGAFKVFAASKRNSSELSGHVYSSKTNSWKTVPFGSEYWFSPVGVFVGGSIHWAIGECGGGHFIESFNLESEEFGRIELPSSRTNAIVDIDADVDATECGWPRTWLGEIGGCLCTLFDNKKGVDVWIMKEYGVIDSWFKLLITIPFAVPQPNLIGGGLNGEIFIMYRHNLMVYSPKDDVSSTATTTINCYRACIYVESLVSPRTNAI